MSETPPEDLRPPISDDNDGSDSTDKRDLDSEQHDSGMTDPVDISPPVSEAAPADAGLPAPARAPFPDDPAAVVNAATEHEGDADPALAAGAAETALVFADTLSDGTDPIPALPDMAITAELTFADLTLAEVLGRGLRAPRRTWARFWGTINVFDEAAQPAPITEPVEAGYSLPPDAEIASVRRAWSDLPIQVAAQELLPSFALLVSGLLLALFGSAIMMAGTSRTEADELARGAPWLLLGFVVWLVAATLTYRDGLSARAGRWLERLMRRRPNADSGEGWDGTADLVTEPDEVSVPDEAIIDEPDRARRLPRWADLAAGAQTHAARLVLAGVGVMLSAAAWVFNPANTFTGIGVFVWIASIIVWLAVLTPPSFDLVEWVAARRAAWGRLLSRDVRLRFSWTALALILILIMAAAFRFADLDGVPPEMTSDHVEKLLDAQRVLDGTTQIFFPNNGGREAIQMYLVAFFSQISGLGMTFTTLKWVSVLEGLLTIPVLWWMGRELIGEEQPQLGNWVGLLLAAFVAASYWHVGLSRLALRIVLTPLIMALVVAYLARAMRHNRRADFLKAGLALGIGMYAYQAVRMIPVVVMLGVGLAFLFRARTWRARGRYVTNFAALVLVALVIFVPLGRFMIESPQHFWMRTAGRFFGDDVITETNPETGIITEREATLEDRLAAFGENLTVLSSNLRNAVLMYNWKGDVAWINGAPNRPAMDSITAALLVLGLAAWLVRLARRRDVVDWLILPAWFIMLLPSALSLAYPVENPSHTRTSGSLPLAYFIAAYGLAFLLLQFHRAFKGRGVRVASMATVVVLVLIGFAANSSLYFGEYRDRYARSSLPYSVAGDVLSGFNDSAGSYGNAFMVAYDYWFDHRAIGIEGGRIDWPNGLLTVYDFPQQVENNLGTAYQFDPNRAVLFFYNQHDEETLPALLAWFPDGMTIYQQTGDEVKDFYTFIAPPPGEEWLQNLLAEN